MNHSHELVLRFAAALGWHGLERTDFTLTSADGGNPPEGTVGTCWSTSWLKFFIQINQETLGQFGSYKVSVVADRFHIAHLDFETCKFVTADEADCEAERVSLRLARANFFSPLWRREYLQQNAHKLMRPKKKWRGWKGRLRASHMSDP